MPKPYWQAFYLADHKVGRYWQMLQLQHQDYQLAPYLFALKDLRNSRLVIRFRCNCIGPHVGTGQFKPVEQTVDREQRFCPVCTCASGTAEDEHHFVFDCSAYCSMRDRFTAIFWGPAPTLSSFFSWQWPCGHAKFLHECFAHSNWLCPHTLCIMLAMIQTRRLNRDYMTWNTHVAKDPQGQSLSNLKSNF